MRLITFQDKAALNAGFQAASPMECVIFVENKQEAESCTLMKDHRLL